MERPLSLVTGACGFMGTHMCEVLREAGHRVRATDLPAAHEKDDRAKGRFPSVVDRTVDEFVPLDLTQPEALARLVEGVDYVFHIAGMFSYSAPYERLWAVNVLGTRALLDAVIAAKRVKRFVNWGAGGVYGLPTWRPGEAFREDDPVMPANPYLRSKWIAEHAVMEAGRLRGLPWASMRPTTVYGPRAVYGSGQMVIGAAQMKIAAIPRNFTAPIPFVHVRDVCGAALHLALHDGGPKGLFNLVDDTVMGSVEFFRYVADLMGHRFVELPSVPILRMKPAIRQVASLVQQVTLQLGVPSPVEADVIDYLEERWNYSNEKLKATGYRFVYADARDGLRETVSWYRENGWLG
jgi:nucleoside-diphosphate-sugar epimerase